MKLFAIKFAFKLLFKKVSLNDFLLVLVDVNDAGEGNMEISITGGGRNIQNHVRQIGPGQFDVSYTPMDEGPHTASVTFNGEHVAGNVIINIKLLLL